VLDGVEIWNRKADGLLPTKAYFEFARSRGLAPTVGMDLHEWRQVFPMWNEIDVARGPLDASIVATALRQRQISPACLFGRFAPGLEGGFSMTLKILACAERARRILRSAREVIQSSKPHRGTREKQPD
jgi:hypothetical protein